MIDWQTSGRNAVIGKISSRHEIAVPIDIVKHDDSGRWSVSLSANGLISENEALHVAIELQRACKRALCARGSDEYV